MYHVVAAAALPFDVRSLLPASWRYDEPPTGALSRDALLDAVAEAHGLISLLTQRVDRALLARAPRLRVIANYAVGFDNVDLVAATERGIVVTNTPDVLTDATADFAFALLLAVARRLVEGDALVRGGSWQGWSPSGFLGAPVARQTLGIIGPGRIGQAVARRAAGFGMNVLYVGRREVGALDAMGARRVELAALLADSDYVTLHCPLTEATRNLIDGAALAAMKPSAIVVNTARGGCVDEAALATALADGTIAGAGLDVFAQEPRLHPGLVASDRVVLAPHAGSATTRARQAMAEICGKAVCDVLSGRRPATVVNPEAWT